eukprot:NODE_924_length_3044_cov_0.424109.p1 type:complete len:780 gc:universal NODE_924_length_3044_cov_0.424109:491-2830(+)
MSPNLKSMLFIYLTMMTRLFGISTDCPNIMSFLQGLNLHITNPILYQSLPSDCCTIYQPGSDGYIEVTCTGSGSSQHVTDITISSTGINGTIKTQFLPATLALLEISATPLNTTIPSNFPNSIQYLFLHDNYLRGSIPNTLPTSLIILQVISNQITALPTTYPNTLTQIYSNYNAIKAMPVIPSTLTNFQVGNNRINDKLPNSFPTSLTDFYVNDNLIYGSFPTNFPNSLKILRLQNNLLTGPMPGSLPTALVEFAAQNNQLTTIPASFPAGVTTLTVNNNLITKLPILPSQLANFNISNNLIYDKMPNTFPSTLVNFDATNNSIYGTIPALPSTIKKLILSHNLLTGNLPVLTIALQQVWLDYNTLIGNLPATWPSTLTNLDLGHNNLTGSISSLSSSSITRLDLSWNHFSGNLPVFKTTAFSLIDLSHNQLSGDIDLGYATISDLRLSFNKFLKYPKTLPKTISSLLLDNNGMNGTITYDLPSTLLYIDLSSNNLTGNLPNWLGTNHSFLNISHNLFIGTIPTSFQYVNTLDISFNYLSGCVNYQFTGSNFTLNNNNLSGNLSFKNPLNLYLQSNRIYDVIISNTSLLNQCDLSNNPMAPGVFGKTFQNQCNLNGIYADSQSNCKTFSLNELIFSPNVAFTTSTSVAIRTSKVTFSSKITATSTIKVTQLSSKQISATIGSAIASKSISLTTSFIKSIYSKSELAQTTSELYSDTPGTVLDKAFTIVTRIFYLSRSNSSDFNEHIDTFKKRPLQRVLLKFDQREFRKYNRKNAIIIT